MRFSHPKIAGSALRSIHQAATATTQSRSYLTLVGKRNLAQRHFHQSPVAFSPRRRNFFTSNVLLQRDGSSTNNEPPDGSGREKNDVSASQKPPAASNTRRKPPLKSSLRRVAVVAQKGTPSRPGGGPVAAAAVAASEAGGVGGGPDDGSSTISAVCVAESFDMDAVAGALRARGFSLDPDTTGFDVHEVVHARTENHGGGAGDIFVFPSGTVVTWSLPPDVVTALATEHLLPAAEDLHLDRKEVEDLEYVEDPEREQSTVSGDVVVLGTAREVQRQRWRRREGEGEEAAAEENDDGGESGRLHTTLAKIAFSSGLARSTKLAVLESSLNRYFETTRGIPALLSGGGGGGSSGWGGLLLSGGAPSRRFILRKTGELLGLRAQLNHYNELTDSLPDIFWDSKSELRLETYYDRVGRALDVGVRIKTLNEKMNYAQEVVDVLRETSSEKHSARLEWIIIALIAVEVLFELRRVHMERLEARADAQRLRPE